MADEAEVRTETFQYEQLDLTKQPIRLIALKHAYSAQDDIECDICAFDLETAPYYVTLSYTWGPPTPMKNIMVNGKRLAVRQNLFDFLCAYRNELSNIHYLWIDQVCISQAHTGERNHQVRVMSQIYSRCLYVIIWLGAKSEAMASKFTRAATLMSASTIFDDPYFRRLWIIQEIFLSPEVRVLCGKIWISWSSLTEALCIESDKREFGDSLFHSHCSNFKEAVTKDIWDKGSLSLLDCLRLFAHHKCEDPRDKVYGLMGLVKQEERLYVDYQKTPHEVFLDVLKSMSLSRWQTVDYDVFHQLIYTSEHMGLANHRLKSDPSCKISKTSATR